MNNSMDKLKKALNEDLSAKLDFNRDVKLKVLAKIAKKEKQDSFFKIPNLISGVVLTTLMVFLSIFTVEHISPGKLLVMEKSSSPISHDRYLYTDAEFGFKLEFPSYLERHIRTFDSENGRTFYYKNPVGLDHVLLHLDIYKKSEESINLQLAGRTLVKESDQFAYYVSDINENIRIMKSDYAEHDIEIMERFAGEFPQYINTLEVANDHELKWQLKVLETHKEQTNLVVNQINELIEKEYQSEDLDAFIRANKGLYNNRYNGNRYSNKQMEEDLLQKFELRNKGGRDFKVKVTPHEMNPLLVKVLVTINFSTLSGPRTVEVEQYQATYEKVNGQWEKIEWNKLN